MNSINKKPTEIEKIIDAIENDIQEISDDEISNIFKNEEKTAQNIRNLFDKAYVESGKMTLLKSKGKINKNKIEHTSNILHLPISKKKEILKHLEGQDNLTIAARKEEELTEEDLNTKLEVFVKLGIIDTDGNPI